MDEKIVFLTILGMAGVTYLPRLFPLLVLSGKKLPEGVVSWLSYVPAAVLAAMLAPAILLSDGKIALGFENLFFWAALPTFVAAIFTKSLFVPVVVGMIVVILGRFLL